MEVLCKYFCWKLQIPWNHDIVQCNCYSLILAPLIVCTPVLRVSMDGSDEEILWAIRKQLLWSASPVSEWSCFSVCWAGLGWAGLGWAGLGWAGVYRPVRQLAGRRTPVVVQWCQLQQWSHPRNTILPATAVNQLRGTQWSEILLTESRPFKDLCG